MVRYGHSTWTRPDPSSKIVGLVELLSAVTLGHVQVQCAGSSLSHRIASLPPTYHRNEHRRQRLPRRDSALSSTLDFGVSKSCRSHFPNSYRPKGDGRRRVKGEKARHSPVTWFWKGTTVVCVNACKRLRRPERNRESSAGRILRRLTPSGSTRPSDQGWVAGS